MWGWAQLNRFKPPSGVLSLIVPRRYSCLHPSFMFVICPCVSSVCCVRVCMRVLVWVCLEWTCFCAVWVAVCFVCGMSCLSYLSIFIFHISSWSNLMIFFSQKINIHDRLIKFWESDSSTLGLHHMTNSEVPDQTPPFQGGVWSGTALFVMADIPVYWQWKG